MATRTLKLVELMETGSIKVYDGMKAVFPQFNQTNTITVKDEAKFNGTFSVNNSTLAFYWEDTMYVCPYSDFNMATLTDAGFERKFYYVPFSNCDYPQKEEDKWKKLQNQVRQEKQKEYEMECMKYCIRKGVMPLPQDILDMCFEVPSTGVPVEHTYYKDRIYPLLIGITFGRKEMERLGHFSCNNGIVSFVYRNGKTYVGRSWLISELEHFGYRHAVMFVPFSNGEKITDPALNARWQQVCDSERQWNINKEYMIHCNERGIKPLSKETLIKCFQMPETGVPVKHIYYETVLYPFSSNKSVDEVKDLLGHFDVNNGIVVFIYRDGKTYVTKSWIVSELESKGYTKRGIFVPFSNGEKITDPVLATKWEAVLSK